MGKPKSQRKKFLERQAGTPDVKYSKTLRKRMYRKVGEACQCCGKKKTQQNGLVLTVHHILPVRAGGLATEENGLVCCKECHVRIHWHIDPKGDQQDFMAELVAYLKTLPNVPVLCQERFGINEERAA